MRLLARAQQGALGAEEIDHARVGVEDLLARELRHLGQEPARLVDRAVDLEAVFHAREVVVPAVAGRGVHDAGAGVERDVLAEHADGVAVDPRVAEAQALQGLALHLRDGLTQRDLRLVPARRRGGAQRLGDEQDVGRALDGIEGVVRLGMEGQGQVGGQRPGRGRPDDGEDAPAVQVGVRRSELLDVVVAQRELHVDGRARVLLVVLDLGFRERRAVRDAPVHGLLGLVDEPLLHELRQLPHDGRLVGRRHGEIGIRPLAHHAQALELGPLDGHELLRVCAAGAAERHRAHVPLLAAEVAVHLQLDGQAMAVPAGDVRRVVPLWSRHGAAAHHHVLEDLVERGAEVDVAVGVGRSVVEHELRRARARLPQPAVEVLRLPQVDAPRLRLGQVRLHGEVGAREVEGGLEVFGGGHGRKTTQRSTTAKNPSIQEDGRGPDPAWRAVG